MKSSSGMQLNSQASAAPSGRAVLLRGRSGAFTLIEVVLAISLFVMLAGAIGFSFFGGTTRKYLDEGSRQFETMLRMMRAEAAVKGRRFRLTFNTEDGRAIVQWEPQPLAEPNQFLDFTAAAWVELVPYDYVRIVSLQRTGDSAVDTLLYGSGEGGEMSDDALTQYIDFYPDGSCDSAVIQLNSGDAGDSRRAVIHVNGVSQQFTSQVLAAEDVSAVYEQMGLVNVAGSNFE